MVLVLAVTRDKKLDKRIRDALGTEGWWVSQVEDRQSALRSAADHEPHLVLVDEDVDGVDDLVRVFGSSGGGPGAVILSDDKDNVRRSPGVDAVFEKAAANGQLLASVKRVMSQPHSPTSAAEIQGGEILTTRDIFGDLLREVVDDLEPARVAEEDGTPAAPSEPAEMAEEQAVEATVELAMEVPEESVVEPVKPAVETAKPAVETAKPAVRTAKPAVETAKPAVRTAKPAVETAKPAVETAKPAVETAKPAVETAKPAVRTAKPAVETARPAVEATGETPEGEAETPVEEIPSEVTARVCEETFEEMSGKEMGEGGNVETAGEPLGETVSETDVGSWFASEVVDPPEVPAYPLETVEIPTELLIAESDVADSRPVWPTEEDKAPDLSLPQEPAEPAEPSELMEPETPDAIPEPSPPRSMKLPEPTQELETPNEPPPPSLELIHPDEGQLATSGAAAASAGEATIEPPRVVEETIGWKRFWLGVAAGLLVFAVTSLLLRVTFGNGRTEPTSTEPATGSLEQGGPASEVTTTGSASSELEELVAEELARRETELRKALVEEERRLQERLDEVDSEKTPSG